MSGSSSVESATNSTTPNPSSVSTTENSSSNNKKNDGNNNTNNVTDTTQLSVDESGSGSPDAPTAEPKPNLTPAPAPKVSAWKVVHSQDSPSIISALSKASSTPSKLAESKSVPTNGSEEGSKKRVSGKEKWVPFTSAAPLFEPARPPARAGRNKNFSSKTSSGSAPPATKSSSSSSSLGNGHQQQSLTNNQQAHASHHHKQHSTSDDASKSKPTGSSFKTRQPDTSKPENATTSAVRHHQWTPPMKDSGSGHSNPRLDQRSFKGKPNGLRKDGEHHHHHFQPRPRIRANQKTHVNGVSGSSPRPDGDLTPETSKESGTDLHATSTFHNGSTALANDNPAFYSPHPTFHRGGDSSSGSSPHFHSKSAPPATGSTSHKISSPASSSVAAFNTSAAAAAAAAAAIGSPPPGFGPFASYPYGGGFQAAPPPPGNSRQSSYRRNFGSQPNNRMGYYPDYNFAFAPHYSSNSGPTPAPPLPEPLSIVAAQVEYYFSIENLCKDIFLRRHMNSKGFVHVSVLANFNRVKTLSNSDIGLLVEACRIAPSVELLGDRIRKASGWETWVMSPRERLPQGRDEVDDEWIENQRQIASAARQPQPFLNHTGLEGLPPSMLFYPFGPYGYGLPPQQQQQPLPQQQQSADTHRLSVASATAAPFVPKVSDTTSSTSSIRNDPVLKNLVISTKEIPGLDVYIPQNDGGFGIGWMTCRNDNEGNNDDETITGYYDLLNDPSKRAIAAKFWQHYLMDNWNDEMFDDLQNASLDRDNKQARNTVYELGSKMKQSPSRHHLGENIDKVYNLALELARFDEAQGLVYGLEKLGLAAGSNNTNSIS